MAAHIFISHASKDDDFVKDLRIALEAHQLTVWVDSRNLRGGNKLTPEISEAIKTARQTIVVLSPHTINSPWVRREIKQALAVEKERQDAGYRVIPLLLPGIEPSALEHWFDEEPVGIKIELKVGSVSEALPHILAALGERLPNDPKSQPTAPAKPVAELLLKLSDPKMQAITGGQRASAKATVIYQPADATAREVESKPFFFTAPLGPIEADDLSWYLEKFYQWPLGVFKERADRIEAQLPQWGQLLHNEAAKTDSAKETWQAWQSAASDVERRFSVCVDSDLPEGTSQEEQNAAREAASLLLALPWELLHDGRGFLFHGKHPVRVRRRLPNRHPQPVTPTRSPIRILLVSPRPEQPGVAYIDHRVSARPLVAAVAALGELAALTVLATPTFPALQAELQRAADANQPYDVVHFDGHGVYDPKVGLGGLCFEDPKDASELEERAAQLVYAEKLAEVMRDHRIPLVFLEACQTAQAESVEASVAASLLNEGVTSVVAMTHSVLVETAQRFVEAFYHELARGARVGSAMLAGQRALQTDTYRGRILGAGELRLQDWFVPVLYQEEQDPRLITQLPSEQAALLEERKRRLSLGALPEAPPHTFIGRSRELLALERLLAQPVRPELAYAVVRGQGGEGKTTLAVELARWLVQTGRFRRAAFVSLEHYTDARGVLDSLGNQLLPAYSVAQYRDLAEALQPVARALSDQPTLIVLDNLESVLPERTTTGSTGDTGSNLDDENGSSTHDDLNTQDNPRAPRVPRGSTEADAIFTLCRSMLRAHPATRIIFTSREPLPAPFNHRHRERALGRLSQTDAIELVSQVLKQEGLEPKHDDAGYAPQEVIDLVEAAGRHARALTLLARETARQGVRATTENVRQLMAELERKHPDDRENSLYASVELSLRRLPPELHEQTKVLAVFHGGANLNVIGMMLEADAETMQRLAAGLVEVGLATAMPYNHLRLDPALPNLMLTRTDPAELLALKARWAKSMLALTGLIYQQLFQNTQLALQLTLLELPNLQNLLVWADEELPSEDVVQLAVRMEDLLANLGRPQALAQAVSVRTAAAQRLGVWSQAQYANACSNIDRLLERHDIQSAYTVAQQLLERCLNAGPAAYFGADFDIAMAHFRLGRVLLSGMAPEQALVPLREARQRLQTLVDAGHRDAAIRVTITFTEAGTCLHDLGRFDEAAAAYEETIRRAEELGDFREAAIGKAQLGKVRISQKRYPEALEHYTAALATFESLGEPGSMATAWYNIGLIHGGTGQFEQAEHAHRQALAIRVRHKLHADEAASLGALGVLYVRIGRLDESATFHRQSAEIFAQMQSLPSEGIARSNLADTLIKLQRYDEARRELRRAIECKKPLGHAAQLWVTWNILHDLEQAIGHAQAAAEARGLAMAAYLAYRRAGGESQNINREGYALVTEAIPQGTTTEAAAQLNAYAEPNDPAWFTALLDKLHAILRGDRQPALAADPVLHYMDAVELMLLLEELG